MPIMRCAKGSPFSSPCPCRLWLAGPPTIGPPEDGAPAPSSVPHALRGCLELSTRRPPPTVPYGFGPSGALDSYRRAGGRQPPPLGKGTGRAIWRVAKRRTGSAEEPGGAWLGAGGKWERRRHHGAY